MKYIQPQPIISDYKPVDYTDVHPPPPPRCALDFKIYLDNDGTTSRTIGDKAVRLESFKGHESLSQFFEFELELATNEVFQSGGNPPSEELDFDQIIGSSATILLGLPETQQDLNKPYPPTGKEGRPVVCFNGIITNIAMGVRGVYHASLKPAVFKLTLQNNYRLFPNCTIIDVIVQILSENNIDFNKQALEKVDGQVITNLPVYRRQDWLQAGETDFDFITRLMNKVNLFYYFTHTATSHTMIITDQPHYQTIYKREVDTQGLSKLTTEIKPLYLSFSKQMSLERDDFITDFKYQQNLTTNGLTTVLAQRQASWESQNTAQTSPVYFDRENQKEKLNMEQIHVVQYGATESEVSQLTDAGVNRIAASRFQFSGSSTCSELKPGYKFQVQQWDKSKKDPKPVLPRIPIRPQLDEREFVAVSVQHHCTALGDYQNQFSAVAAEGLPLPFNAHDTQQGQILAKVTAKPANASTSSQSAALGISEIDHVGSAAKQLEKTVFTFDSKNFTYRIKQQDDTHSYACRGVYVRFIDQPDTAAAQWVKLAEHMTTIPEVGVYVVISRSMDSNEVPEVQQIVEAKGSQVIMPEGYNCHTSVGNQYSTNYGNATNIGFGADVTTALSDAQTIANGQRQSNNYHNVSYNEYSSYGYSVSACSHHISMTGDVSQSRPDYNPANMMDYVAYNYSATYGDIYNQSLTTGDSTHLSTTTGDTSSTSEQTGDVTSSNTLTGDSSSTAYNDGNVTNSSTVTGASSHTSEVQSGSTATSTVAGGSRNESYVDSSVNFSVMGSSYNLHAIGNETTGKGQVSDSPDLKGNVSYNESYTYGNSYQKSTITGKTESENTVDGHSKHTSKQLGGVHSESTVTGGSYSHSTVDKSNSINMIGASQSLQLAGATAHESAELVSTKMSFIGKSLNMHTGISDTTIHAWAKTNTVRITGTGVEYRNKGTANIEQLPLGKIDLVGAIKLLL